MLYNLNYFTIHTSWNREEFMRFNKIYVIVHFENVQLSAGLRDCLTLLLPLELSITDNQRMLGTVVSLKCAVASRECPNNSLLSVWPPKKNYSSHCPLKSYNSSIQSCPPSQYLSTSMVYYSHRLHPHCKLNQIQRVSLRTKLENQHRWNSCTGSQYLGSRPV